MKIAKILIVADKERKIVSENVILDLAAPGRAVFVAQAGAVAAGDVVQFKLGTSYSKLALWFSGYVESCMRIDSKQLRLIVREYSALLAKRWPMAQRNTTARRILTELAGCTGIAFRTSAAAADWLDRPIAHFIKIGNGYEILELIGKHLEISDFIWQNQPDGAVFIGSGNELAGAVTTLKFPATFFTQLTGTGADCPCLPDLRPGRRIRIGETEPVRISTVTLNGEKMRIGFEC